MARSLPLGVAALLALSSGRGAARAADAKPPKPAFDRVEYGKPRSYVALLPTMGKKDVIEKAAAEVKGASFEEKVSGVSAWIGAHLRYDDKAAYEWRPFDRILSDGTYGGCADHALVYGCLLRALGVPTVWVKTMDCDWIREFRAKGEAGIRNWRGHVFLEVYDGRRWLLLNATEGVLHEDYDVRSRILPGCRFAYDKGGDPYELVLSVRWEEWKEQTRAVLKDFDLAQLPVPAGRQLEADPKRTAYIAADEPGWDRLAARLASLGWKIGRSGNTNFDEWMPRARGRTLVVASVAGNEVLPEAYRAAYEPKPFASLATEEKRGEEWVLRQSLPDGTRVVLLYGKDEDALARVIAGLVPEEAK